MKNIAFVKVLAFIAFFAVLCHETKGCITDSDCSGSQVCCEHDCYDSCLGPHSCILNSDCGGSTYCCNSDICLDSCVGYSCDFDTDCGAPNETCCDGTCENEPYTCLAVWVIVLIVLGSLSVYGIIIGLLLYWCCSYCNRRPVTTLVGAPRSAVVTGSHVNYGSVHP